MDALANLGLSPTMLVALGGGLFAVIALGFGARALFGGKRDEVIERLERATGGDIPIVVDDKPAQSAAFFARLLRPLARLAKPSGDSEDMSRLSQRLTHAGYRTENALEIFLGVKLLLPPIIILILWQVDAHRETPMETVPAVAISLIAIAITFFLPNLWLSGKISERQMAIEDNLPDAMDLLVTCVEAGLALDAAMARVGQELELVAPILAHEIKQTLLEIHAGVRRADAFHRLSTRTGVEDLRTLSAMIIQTEMFGTSVSRALRVHSEGMRTKRMQRAEEKAAMVSVKMTVPLILCILPSLMCVVIGPAVVMIMSRMGGM
jgi:tight adherence protein C